MAHESILTTSEGKGTGGSTQTTTVNFSTDKDGFSGSAFNYLYNVMTYGNSIRMLAHPDTYSVSKKGDEQEFKVTNISPQNPFYIKSGYPVYGNSKEKKGYSTACLIDRNDRKNIMWGNRSNYSGQIGAKLDNVSYTVLPNCVGFANGRSFEVWNLALKSGYLKKEGNKYVIPSRNNLEVEPFMGVPACNAYSFAFNYLYNGKTPGYSKSKDPQPGDIACWKKRSAWDGQPGHVAFVEAVYNKGTPDEYILTSESGYCASGVKVVVWISRLFKRDGYSCNTGPLEAFLHSPINKLAAFGGDINSYSATITQDGTIVPTGSDVEAWKQWKEQFGKVILKELKINDRVEIQWFGNSKPDGSGKRLNKMGVIAKVIGKDLTNKYSYALSLDDKTILGYYERSSIKLIEN